jgi:hypothetical protein
MEHSEGTIVEPGPRKAGQTAEAGVIRTIEATNVSSIFWGMKGIRAQGPFKLNFFFEDPVIVRVDSQVAVSITELNEANVPHLGTATMGILNVIPQADGTITVVGHVDHPAQLHCMLNFIIVN